MFNYDLYLHKQTGAASAYNEASELSGAPSKTAEIQQSGDAIVVVFPYQDADTFDFETGSGKHISVKENKWGAPPTERPIALASPLVLDTWITDLSVQQSKGAHQGALNLTLLDPNDSLLAKTSPGDWIVCWMFNNPGSGAAMRKKMRLEAGEPSFKDLNGFDSGLKFIGKVFSIRKNLSVMPNGNRVRRVQIVAFSFSELDSGIYFDPALMDNRWRGTEYMGAISDYVTGKRSTIEQVGKTLGEFISVFLGKGLKGSLAASTSFRPLRIPSVIGSILGKPETQYYIDILNTNIGIQKYSGKYTPDGLKPGTGGIATSIQYTPNPLTGYVNPIVSPFRNIPIWGLLHNFSNPAINEMYTALKMDGNGKLQPTLTIRQIPFNTEEFVQRFDPQVPATAFRSLPRWEVSDEIITSYSLGKSDAMRVNFVQVTPLILDFGQRATELAARKAINPTSDIVDYERNGLRARVQGINTVYGVGGVADTQKWTYVISDRDMGGHLKLTGSMTLVGVEEPICVGDNLKYGKLIFHIEQIEHKLTVDGQSGRKTFSTLLAISNGVPATGPLFPEIDVRSGTKQESGLISNSYVRLPGRYLDTSKKDEG